ncbi:MAG: hypothetical protein KAS30_01370, partial [Candidatus Diapherotrites archaeon]|nr:hypothetical protein [Candidatus Diapherotrites archaeon]
MTCTFNSIENDTSNTVYCRVYDGTDYSSDVSTNYTSDSTPPTTTLTSIAGDVSNPYLDATNDNTTDIIIAGESSMVCRFGSTDIIYSSMDSENECSIDDTNATCSLGALAQNNYTKHISCKDSLENEQTTEQNLDISFEVAFNPIPQLTQLNSNPSPVKGGSDITITATATDSDLDSLNLYCATTSSAGESNTDVCSYTANASPYSGVSCAGTAISDDLNHTVYCRIFDGTDYSSELTTTYTSDSTAPDLNVTAVQAYSKSIITINATATDTNIDKLNLINASDPDTIIDSNSTPIENDYSLDLNTTAISDGNTTFIVQAIDSVENTTESQFWTIIDNTSPAIENTSGTIGFIQGTETETFSISITEANRDESSVKIYWREGTTGSFNDVNATCAGINPNYNCSIDLNLTSIAEETEIQFFGKAKDYADTNNTSTQSNTIIDRTPPTVNTPAVNNSRVGENSVVYIPTSFETSAVASDNNTTISCYYSLNNGITWSNDSTSYSAGKCISNITGQSNGANLSIRFKATDAVTNQSIGSDFNATVDGVGPTITNISITYPDNGTVVENDESIIVKATILEESCAVSTVILNATIIGGSASLAMNDSGING